MSCRLKSSWYKFSVFIAAALLSFSASTVLAASGDFDVSFGTGGVVHTFVDLGDGHQARAVAVQPDGKIVAAGYYLDKFVDANGNDAFRRDFMVVRYAANGALDPTFGTAGVVLTNVSNFDIADEIVVQPDGKILIYGASFRGSFSDFTLVRYEADGSLDETFGDRIFVSGGEGTPVITKGSGIVRMSAFQADGITSSNNALSVPNGMALQPDGKILISGSVRQSLRWNIVVARL